MAPALDEITMRLFEVDVGPRIANSGWHFQFGQEYKQNFDSLFSAGS
ncbi:MAG: hypothetical protein WBW37_12090 [Methyloceanibacter sp.]|jgi:hypothetical protein